MSKNELTFRQLYHVCSLSGMDFETTKELDSNADVIGQEKAIEAIQFAVRMPAADGYNVFCLGAEGIGKKSLALQLLTKEAADKKTPSDWCYVNNFAFPHKPVAIELAAGKGRTFARDIEKLIADIQFALPALFESDDYKGQVAQIEADFKEQKEAYFNGLQDIAKGKKNVSILRMPTGLVVAPTRNGQVLTPETFDKLPKATRKAILEQMNDTQNLLEKAVCEVPRWEKEQKEKINSLNELMTHQALHQSMHDVMKKYDDNVAICDYLTAMRKDIVEHIALFLDESTKEDDDTDQVGAFVRKSRKNADVSNRYKVNVLVSNTGKKVGAPVIYLDHPNLPNLVGRMERKQQLGSLVTDFSLIKAGALHQANGGYLILDARDLCAHSSAWESLKRALKSKKIAIESAEDESGVVSTTTLEPEPIPLDIKVILIGENELYYALSDNDADFHSLFKVEANFYPRIDRTADNVKKYLSLMANLIKKFKLKAFDKMALARLIEYTSRLAQDKDKMTTRISLISDLMKEADYFAREEKKGLVERAHVNKAIFAKVNRSNNLHQRMLENVKNGTILLNTDGKEVGQINILAVQEYGQTLFGRANRLTCQTRVGSGEVIDIEREVDLGGSFHSKGVLILSSFLAAKFAKDEPLSLNASLAIEQSYGAVDGDSASGAELYALLSSIANVPLNQGLAVTGSVNQLGQIQAIGSVNEKIEGYFDVCLAKGLTGTQGVLIPAANVRHLMLRDDVVDAVKRGRFHIYAVNTIDEGIELLTGLSAGKAGRGGKYPAKSVYGRIQARLHTLYVKTKKLPPPRTVAPVLAKSLPNKKRTFWK